MRENEKLLRFVYQNGELLYEEGGDKETASCHLGAGIEAVRRGQRTYYYHPDEQLSTALITDETGTIKNQYRYDAFGAGLEVSEELPNRIRYTGQQYDEITEQYYLRARYYNPILGRFLQEDVYQGDGLNLYAYCRNNPVVYWDPSGYAKRPDCGNTGEINDDTSQENEDTRKRMGVSISGHHVPAVRKSEDRPFEVKRSDKTRPTLFPIGDDPEYDHWRMHDAEREHIGPRQGDFIGTDDELFDAYRRAYEKLDDIKVDVKAPNNSTTLGKGVTPLEAVDLIQNWLKKKGLYGNKS